MSSNTKYDRMMDPPPAYSEQDPQKTPNPTNSAPYSQSHPVLPEYTHVNMMPPNQNYGSMIVDQPVTVPVTQVILIGGCPACRVGILEDSYSFLGILCAILFFPVGVLCCLALKDKRCSNCGASF